MPSFDRARVLPRIGIVALNGQAQTSDVIEGSDNQTSPPADYVSRAGDNMFGFLTLNDDPQDVLHAASKQYVDRLVAGATGVDTTVFVNVSGGTMTGRLTLAGDPTAGDHAATKAYVDGKTDFGSLSDYLPKGGGSISGALLLGQAPTQPMHAATKAYVDTTTGGIDLSGLVAKSGGSMSGALSLSGAPTLASHAATKAYVDSFVPLTGGTMNGLLTLSGAPSSALHAATKAYVDRVANVRVYRFTINFDGTTPNSFTNLPPGWSVTALGDTVQVTHSVGTRPVQITAWGLTSSANIWSQVVFGDDLLMNYDATNTNQFTIVGVSSTRMNAPGSVADVHVFF